MLSDLKSILIPPEEETIRISRELSDTLLRNYTPSSPAIDKIIRHIENHSRFLLTTHIHPDSDGVGAAVGLLALLAHFQKDAILLLDEKIESRLELLISGLPVAYMDDDVDKEMLKDRLAIILDSSDFKRSGKTADLIEELGLPWISIDHHIVEEDEHYCVDSSYAATCEMIWDLYRAMKVPISETARFALYSGLVTDSGNFRYPKTSLRTHLAGGDLLPETANSDSIYRLHYEFSPIDKLIYFRRILKKVKINKELGYVLGFVTPRTSHGLDLGDSANDGIVNQLLAYKGIRLSALMTKTDDGCMKCSLRSIGDVDVAAIAKVFGGGGHKNAAGFKTNLKYRKAKKKLIQEIEKVLVNRA
ncbi:MAG: hypothetical protein D6767_02820 [Candidatus Hydrogenedentota bacterium]|nr:MAG: hypothetical protein D6767_02820 [Candidatus Hydrogenedentota bacterium]